MCGREACVAGGVCGGGGVVGGHVWQGGMCDRGDACWGGACVAGGILVLVLVQLYFHWHKNISVNSYTQFRDPCLFALGQMSMFWISYLCPCELVTAGKHSL